MKYEDALKQTRRNTFLFGKDWRTAVVCQSYGQMAIAWDETRFQIEASSLNLERANYATRTMELERGAIIRFYSKTDYALSLIQGNNFTQIMLLHGDERYGFEMMEALRSQLRSDAVPADKLLWQEYVTL